MEAGPGGEVPKRCQVEIRGDILSRVGMNNKLGRLTV
jgi:hypothetical protein